VPEKSGTYTSAAYTSSPLRQAKPTLISADPKQRTSENVRFAPEEPTRDKLSRNLVNA
jgi:hypothetical protein